MAWATEIKSLVSDIKTSTKDRLQFVKDNQQDTRGLLARFNKELKEMAQDTGELLARFDKELKEMAKDLKDFLAKSEQTRMADFKTTMKDVQSKIDSIQKHVANLLGDYAEERKEAHANWGMLRKREKAIAEEKAEEVEKKAKKQKAE
ncbi:MAG: hypothetical protein NTV77_03540 [Candidatus Azambacteria bacterium]|nr:hypothetical protein [Candidatus Azambacteria bacterium]